MSEIKIARVILDEGIDKPLDYAIPLPLLGKIEAGMRVLAPVKGHPRKGTVIALKEAAEVARVSPLSEILSEDSFVSKEQFLLASWIARYYCVPLRRALRLMLPPPIRKKEKPPEQFFISPLLSPKELASFCEKERRKSPQQALVLDLLLQTPRGLFLTEILEKTGSSKSPIDTLIKKKILQCKSAAVERPLPQAEYIQTQPKNLSGEQAEALTKIKTSISCGRFEAHLLHGVTGSGKTEVYLQAISHALSLEMGVILLVPEIALTSQIIEHLQSRFAEKIALVHHRLSDGERQSFWHTIRQKKAPIVIGARSAIFSPVPALGLIIVDEEHEPSYKQQEEAPAYNARDVAVMRAKLCNATIILGSATPSLESYHNAQLGKYTLSNLSSRVSGAKLPSVHIVNMQEEKAKGSSLFSERLLEGIKKRSAVGEQSILFLNRRGFHTSQVCNHCQKAIKCTQCDTALTYHRGAETLACHLCDYRLSPPPRTCPSCGAHECLKFKGAGTEQVERALHAIFPEVRTLRIDADTTRHKGSHEKLFKAFRSAKADVLIGTQMIAKGLHFPNVTLASVLNADSALNIPDFRVSEHLFHLITQVSGRAGRGALAGEVILQTYLPEHPLILQAAEHRFFEFCEEELKVRKQFSYPPFTHLVKLVFSSKVERSALSYAQAFRESLIAKLPPSYELLPVIPCGHAKIQGLFRFQCLIKGEKIAPLASILEEMQRLLPLPRGVSLLIDIDPGSTF